MRRSYTYLKPDSVFVTRSADKLELVMVGESDQIYQLDAHAMTVWEGLERGLDLDDITATIVTTTGRANLEISNHVKALVKQLVSAGLLQKIPA
jgi:hypothetical protein